MHRERGATGERGSALLYVILLLVITTTAGMLLAVSLAVDARTRKEDARRVRLAPLVDSAVAEGIAALTLDPDHPGYERHAFGGGSLESSITALPDGRREIHARARYAGVERSVFVEVVFESDGPRIVAWRPTRSAP